MLLQGMSLVTFMVDIHNIYIYIYIYIYTIINMNRNYNFKLYYKPYRIECCR